jgi:membrane-associated phospholipid phosphatase
MPRRRTTHRNAIRIAGLALIVCSSAVARTGVADPAAAQPGDDAARADRAAQADKAAPADATPRERTPALVAHPVLEWSAVAAGGALWLTTGTLIKPDIAPEECRWCDGNAFDDELRSLRWSDRRAADLTSDIISYGVAPVSAGALVAIAAASSGRAGELSVDLPILAEALVASGLLGEALRLSTARERPSVRALPPDEKPMTDHPEENNLSFVSGHSATSFALAVSSGMIASMRRRRLAPLIWATGLTLAAATSYLRIASDEHYVTDVLGGAALGAAVGLAIPLLHRPRGERAPAVAIGPAPGGAALLLVWR